MFSLDNFYQIISQNLFKPLGFFMAHAFEHFGSTDFNDLEPVAGKTPYKKMHVNELNPFNQIIFHDQEPFYLRNFVTQISDQNSSIQCPEFLFNRGYELTYFTDSFRIFSNSEHSQEKSDFCKYFDFHDWYYFFHGFAALDWYRNIRYMPPIKNYSKVFISFNNLCSGKRNYRLNLIARMLEQGLDKQGYISLSYNNDLVNKELFSVDSLLSKESKKIILSQLQNSPKLTIDTESQHGALSANDNLETMALGLFHIVTETIFYDSKLHLTEKVFKPIVARRPFVIVAAPGNLAYLRSYGFKTFDQWIDESYDLEQDPDQRIIKIVAEITRLCQLSSIELDIMYQEMQEVIDYNYNWFYGGFKQHIVNELVDNFHRCLIKHNAGRDPSFNNYIHYPIQKLAQVKNRLAQ